MSYRIWPWDPDYSLPAEARDEERSLAARLGDRGLRAIEDNLVRQASERSYKVLRVVMRAMEAGGYSFHDDACFELHLRCLIGAVESGRLVGLGNLRRPGFSEVCLPE